MTPYEVINIELDRLNKARLQIIAWERVAGLGEIERQIQKLHDALSESIKNK